MMKTHNFKRKLIASAVAASALAGFGNLAYAQDQSADQSQMLEEVVVTGIRASLQRSMDLKRDSQGVVDAISAEDIGKFPDTNLAESLQRITGVSIDRSNGEGSKVTVRGLGPDFNLVTLNGRQMPGVSINATSASGSRSFDFGNLASEGVQAVEVYKTSRADEPSGGMGATINIVTPKPLEIAPKASIGVKGVWDTSSEDTELTPEISGIYSNSFADGKFGVAVTASYQDRKGGGASATTGAGWSGVAGTVHQDWSGQEGVDWAWGGMGFSDTTVRNPPADNDVYGIPQQVAYTFNEFERKRTNGQLTLQFAPTDTLTATLDYTYSANEFTNTYHDLGAWFAWGAQSAIFTDNESPAVQTPLLYSEAQNHGDLTMGSGVEKTKAENKSVGLNIKWQPVDQLTLTLDAHSSSAELGPDSPYGNSAGISVTSFSRMRTTLNTKGEVPTLVLDLDNSEGGQALLPQDMQVSGSWFRTSETENKIKQYQLDGQWDFNEDVNLKFGIARTESNYTSAFQDNLRNTWGGLGAPGDVPESIFTKDTILDKFSGSIGQTTQEEMNFLGGSNTTPINERFVTDFYALRDFAAKTYPGSDGNANCADGSTWYCAPEPNQYNKIQEDTDSAYLQFNYATELATMPFQANAGVRYEKTTVETPATVQAYGPVSWVSGNELYIHPQGSPTHISDSGDYNAVLPSVDLRLDVTDNIALRASYGETIARPDWLALRGGTSVNEMLRVNGGTASQGTPGLEPYKSKNFDLSLEWYYGDASYASIGYFRKDVSDFVSSHVELGQTLSSVGNSPNPALGKRAQAAWASGIARTDVGAVRQYIYDNYPDPDTAYMDPTTNSIVIVGIPGEDPNATFDVTKNYNADNSVTVDGWEFAVQHNFWDSGFGVIANYTLVDESVGYQPLVLGGGQMPITGLSNTANLVAFYDKNGLQARIAYNWRDHFLASTASGTGNNPVNVEAYNQVDANISYDLTDNLSIFVEGLNLTSESGRNYGRTETAVMGWYEGYARYNIGARYTF